MGTEYENSTPIRTVIAMDFDNDGNQELFMNNIDYQSRGAPNSVHSVINSANVSVKADGPRNSSRILVRKAANMAYLKVAPISVHQLS